jgi:hypothetical protein
VELPADESGAAAGGDVGTPTIGGLDDAPAPGGGETGSAPATPGDDDNTGGGEEPVVGGGCEIPAMSPGEDEERSAASGGRDMAAAAPELAGLMLSSMAGASRMGPRFGAVSPAGGDVPSSASEPLPMETLGRRVVVRLPLSRRSCSSSTMPTARGMIAAGEPAVSVCATAAPPGSCEDACAVGAWAGGRVANAPAV